MLRRLETARTYIQNGDIAQLVERLNGIQEVMGSIPTISTKTMKVVLNRQIYHNFHGYFFAFSTAFSTFRANLL